jgi:hypothetical protein
MMPSPSARRHVGRLGYQAGPPETDFDLFRTTCRSRVRPFVARVSRPSRDEFIPIFSQQEQHTTSRIDLIETQSVNSAIGAVVMWDAGPAWYSIAIILIALPCAWVGGTLVARER